MSPLAKEKKSAVVHCLRQSISPFHMFGQYKWLVHTCMEYVFHVYWGRGPSNTALLKRLESSAILPLINGHPLIDFLYSLKAHCSVSYLAIFCLCFHCWSSLNLLNAWLLSQAAPLYVQNFLLVRIHIHDLVTLLMQELSISLPLPAV